MPKRPTAVEKSPVDRVTDLLGMVEEVPDTWYEAPKRSRNVYTTTCTEYHELVKHWREALEWTEGLDAALVVMLAASASTKLLGEQLWFKILGPPSCGKTTLLEGLATNKKYVFSKDTIRGFYSGWKGDGEDESIAALAKDRTLATKDGDTLLKAPNLQQILAEGRGLYDRVGRTHYRNQVSNDYEGHRMTWLLCGTSALREIDDSELGARFLDCTIMDDIDDEFEDRVSLRAALQEFKNVRVESDGAPETHNPQELTTAMAMTGGYLGYLRENMAKLTSQVRCSDANILKCSKMGKFVAYMRARPKQEESGREFSGRLSKQMVRLATCTAVVLNRDEVDDRVMDIVRKVATDTGKGATLDICRKLRRFKGLQRKGIEMYTGHERSTRYLKFLKRLGVLVAVRTEKGEVWKLTDRIRNLWDEVLT